MKRFILLMFAFILFFALIACGDSDETVDSSEPDTNEAEVDNGEEANDEEEEAGETGEGSLGIGDTAEFDDVIFTLKDVTTTDERNEFADSDPNVVIKIEYELENIGDDDYPYGVDITVYDADGNKMDTYPLDSDMGSVAPGKKVQAVEHHEVEATGTIEIHFAPLMSFDGAAVFEVEIE
ncbi:MAG TPA: DUF4352 domain-containing protein [Pseudogracilibacillus sp.]|nr:DUF4352 domain-containing protein [Pseudogracilibacillus sp.]